jgi:hypothetical protein
VCWFLIQNNPTKSSSIWPEWDTVDDPTLRIVDQ